MELRVYSEYILQFFGALPRSQGKVINLDKAIRRYVGEVKHIELADVARFRHLEARYLQHDGAGNQASPRKERRIETSTEYMWPKFARDLVWGTVEDDVSPAAHYSLTADPLP